MANARTNEAMRMGAGEPVERAELDAGYDRRPGFDQRLAERLKRGLKRGAQAGLRVGFGAVGFATRTRDGNHAGPRDARRVRRILVVRVDLLGDVVLSLP